MEYSLNQHAVVVIQGSYANEVPAAMAHDVMALKCRREQDPLLNLPRAAYSELQPSLAQLSEVRRLVTGQTGFRIWFDILFPVGGLCLHSP